MNRLFRSLMILSSLVMLQGCASTMQYSAPAGVLSAPVPKDKARIYAVRPSSIGTAIGIGIFDGNDEVGRLGPHGCVSWFRDAGAASIRAQGEISKTISFTAEAGKTYFLQIGLWDGLFVGGATIQLIDEKQGMDLVNELK